MTGRLGIRADATREYLAHDLGYLREPVARAAWLSARALMAAPSEGRRADGFRMLMRLHRAGLSGRLDPAIGATLADAIAREKRGTGTGLGHLFDRTVADAVSRFRASSQSDPKRLVGSRILAVKSARPGERGVLVVDYEYVLPLFVGLFDAPAIVERYDVVLEPSWAGVCAPELLLYSRVARPITVQTMEPRDHALLSALGANFDVVPIAANWWVEPGSGPPPAATRDLDVAMVAAWAGIKRHWRFFAALADLRRRGHVLKVALVGYPGDRTRADIETLARQYGIIDQLEIHERIPEEAVRRILARSKIHVLWSRREASGRAIIEALLADTPVIVREGLTFGHRYPYINAQTGRFVRENELADAMLDMIASRDQFSPRRWVLGSMTSEKTTQLLEDHLKARALSRKEPWSEGLVAKVSALDAQRYADPADRERFRGDYAFLTDAIRPETKR